MLTAVSKPTLASVSTTSLSMVLGIPTIGIPRFHSSYAIPKVPSPFPTITGDRDLLVLAVYNLVENALKFTCETDSVEIRLLEDGRAILIEVADSGAGIPAEDVSKIFEELYRGSNARSTEGSGLGLALVHRIISLHGGQIDVRSSQEEPRGTVFTIRLPVTKKGFAFRTAN